MVEEFNEDNKIEKLKEGFEHFGKVTQTEKETLSEKIGLSDESGILSVTNTKEKIQNAQKRLKTFINGRNGETCLDEHTTCECDVCQIARETDKIFKEEFGGALV